MADTNTIVFVIYSMIIIGAWVYAVWRDHVVPAIKEVEAYECVFAAAEITNRHIQQIKGTWYVSQKGAFYDSALE